MTNNPFKALVEGSIQAKLVHVDGVPLYANLACARLYGFSSPDALLECADFSAMIAGSLNAPAMGQHESIHTRRDGGRVPVIVAQRPIDWHGQRATQCAVTDLERDRQTEEALAEAKERYDLAVKGSAVGIWDQDRRNGRYYWSGRMRQLLGVSETDERNPMEIFQGLVHPDDWQGVRAAARRAFTERGLYVASFRVIRPDGRVKWIQATGRAIQDASGRVLRFAGSAQDVTVEKVREQGQIAARGRAEAEAAARSRFMAALTHEVRTPLNAVLNACELMSGTALSDDQRALLADASASGAALLAMLEDVLDLSRLETDAFLLQCAPFRLDHALEEALVALSARAADKGLAVTCSIDPRARSIFLGDARQWARIARHLIDNAVKFTADGSIALRLSVGDTGHGVLLEVEDTGPGLPPATAKAVFEPFVQVDSSIRRRADGLGVGLALCRRLARAMDGELAVQSAPGQGSVFRFYTPLELSAVDAESETGPESGQLNVLVAEDNPANRRVLGLILEKLGHTAAFAENGQVCVEMLDLAQFDLILMDLHMPVMDGYTATRAIRGRTGPESRIPVIALTADAREGARLEAKASGLDGFLTKPIIISQLAATLSHWAAASQRDVGATIKAA